MLVPVSLLKFVCAPSSQPKCLSVSARARGGGGGGGAQGRRAGALVQQTLAHAASGKQAWRHAKLRYGVRQQGRHRGRRARCTGPAGWQRQGQKRRARAAARRGRSAQVGGRSSARAMSTLFTTLVLIPFPRPSTCSAPTRECAAPRAGWVVTHLSALNNARCNRPSSRQNTVRPLRPARARARALRAPASAAHLRNQLGHLIAVEGIAGVIRADILHLCCRPNGAACASSGACSRGSKWTYAVAAVPLGPQTESCLDGSIFEASGAGMNRVPCAQSAEGLQMTWERAEESRCKYVAQVANTRMSRNSGAPGGHLCAACRQARARGPTRRRRACPEGAPGKPVARTRACQRATSRHSLEWQAALHARIFNP